MKRTLRISLLAAAGVVALGVAGIGIGLATFDLNSFKPRIVDAVQRATGRNLTITGDIRLRPSLWPMVELSDVSLSNPPGFSRPAMATLKHLRLSLALLPLLSRKVQIDSLTLVQPDILLERSAAGQPNWAFTPRDSALGSPRGSAPAAATPADASAEPRKRLLINVHAVSIEDGKVAFHDAQSGVAGTADIASLTAGAAGPEAPLHLDATATYNGVPVTVTADTGGIARLQNPQDTTPWPVKLALGLASARIIAEGALTHPELGQGYDIAVKGTVPDTAALAPLLPSARLPAVHDVAFAVTAADSGQAWPTLKAISLHAGKGDLGNGVSLTRLELGALAVDQPMTLDMAASLNGTPVSAAGTIGSPLKTPVPFDLALHIADDPLAIKGNATPPAGGFGNGVVLQGLTMTGPQIDLAAEASLTLTPRPAITGGIDASRVNADALLALADRLGNAPPPAGSASTATPAPAPPPRAKSNLLIPDTKLPFEQLLAADADLRLAIGTLTVAGHEDHKIASHIVLNNGRLSVDSFSGDLPQGHMDGALSVDASQATPPVHIRLHAPGLSLRALLQAAGQPAVMTGTVEVYADLNGAGDSPHAIASTLNGTLGVAVAGGTIDNRLLGSVLGPVVRTINALDLVGRGGASDLRCIAARVDAHQGVASVRTLALSSSLITMTGSGTVYLAPETLNLRLRPEARIAGATVIIPLELTGPIRNPAAKVNEIKSFGESAPSIAGSVIGKATPLGIVGGLLGANQLLGGDGDPCPAALAVARGQAAPAETPAARPAEPRLPIPNLPDATKALRNLFR